MISFFKELNKKQWIELAVASIFIVISSYLLGGRLFVGGSCFLVALIILDHITTEVEEKCQK